MARKKRRPGVAEIELRQVTKSYGDVIATRDLTLAVPEGQFTTIIGPSGSGKTTLLNLIAGLIQPTQGRIVIAGRDVTSLPPSRRNIGLVFQSYALFPHLSVYENVAFPLRVRKVGKQEIDRCVDEALELVRLGEYGQRKPSQLSGGQQQRVAIARALVFRPDILLLDEPLAALDRKLREEVRLEIREIQRTVGITTLLVTHDQEEALSLSDQVVVIDNGCIQQIASPEAAYHQPATKFVASFLGEANILEGKVERDAAGSRVTLWNGFSLPCPKNAGQEGATVCAMVRPERVRLTALPGELGHTATVKGRVFLGQHWRYRLEVGPAQHLIAVDGNIDRQFELDDTIGVEWRDEDVWFIPEGRVSGPAEENSK
jgi:ABC-type Fe3+/spermidine/putrescine transport system ATPase subunit